MIAGVEIWKCFTWPRPRQFLGWFVIGQMRLDIFYLCAKFDHSSHRRSSDMIAGVEIENVSPDSDHAF